MIHQLTSQALAALSPADRFLTVATARGNQWRWSRPDQAYGSCPICSGNAGLGIGDDGSCGFTCFRGCRTFDVLDAIELPRWALFARGTRGPAVDHAARDRMAQADQRAAALRANPRLLDLVAEVEKVAPWALSEHGFGLLADRGFSVPERDHRGQVTAQNIIVPKGLRDRVIGPAKRVESGGRRGLVFPLSGLIAGDDLIVVEGAFSAVAAATLGHQSLALPSASWNFPTSWARSFFRDRSVTLLPDGDPQGHAVMERTAASALEAGARSVGIVGLHGDHEHGRDLADDLREHGRDAAAEMLATAIGHTTFTQPARSPRGGRPPKSIEAAQRFLGEALGDGGWHPVADIYARAPPEISQRTFARARDVLGVESRKQGKGWEIRLSRAPSI